MNRSDPGARPPSGETGRKLSPLAHDVLVTLPSRQLRAPLATMVGVAELIATGEMTAKQCSAYAAILLREGNRLTAMVKSAVEIEDLETGERPFDQIPTDLAALIHRAVKAAGEDQERPIRVDLPEILPLVSADPEAIMEVLANFLSNARGFSPAGGRTTVTARETPERVEVSITDEGIGIEAEALPRLCAKFYRADPRMRPGLGLGLAINQGIVEGHGGKIAVRSSGPGKGSRFEFTLAKAMPAPGSADVLIVEDLAAYAALLKTELTAAGLTSVRAADAESAERILASTTPRMILLDLMLPGMRGEELLAKLATRPGASIPVVVLTVSELDPAEISALEASGAVAVLPKGAGAPQAAVSLIADRLGLAPKPR